MPSVPMPPTVPLRRLLPKLPTEVPSGHREGPSLPCPESSSGLCSPDHFSLQLSECWPSPFSRPKVSTQGHSPLSHAHHTPVKPGRMDRGPHAGPMRAPRNSPFPRLGPIGPLDIPTRGAHGPRPSILLPCWPFPPDHHTPLGGPDCGRLCMHSFIRSFVHLLLWSACVRAGDLV